MRPSTQDLINGLDKTTVDGLAEAILIAFHSVVDEEGRRIAPRMAETVQEEINYARQMAKMLLGK